MNKTVKIHLLRRMIKIRCFEEKVTTLKLKGLVLGPVHTYVGQEAIAVGVCSALSAEDYVVGNHRSHGYMIAKGADCSSLMAEIFGKSTGTNGGKGGSMHVNDASVGGLGASGIVGSGLPIACGAAFASKYMGNGRISCVFFGDGAANEGTFHECMNLASVWQLPVLFVLENNNVAVTTLLAQVSSTQDLYRRACGYGVTGKQVDGQDVEEVYKAAKRMISRIRSGKGPALLEAKTFRFREHQEGATYARMAETGYRDQHEVESWIANKDPIKTFSDRLVHEEIAARCDIELIHAEENLALEEAIAFAESSPFPEKDDAYSDVFAGESA